MKEPIEITYIGYSDKMISLLLKDKRFTVKSVVSKNNAVSQKNIDFLEKNNIFYVLDDDSSHLESYIKSDVCLIYKYGHIISKAIIDNHSFFNIHPGSIRTNRGAHPVRWSVLLGDECTYLSLYKIDGIDEGLLVNEYKLDIVDLNYEEVDSLMDQNLGKITASLADFLSGKINPAELETVKKGTYRKKVAEADYTIDLTNDSKEIILQKINAVSDFGGAVVFHNDIKYRVGKVYSVEDYQKQNANAENTSDNLFLRGKDCIIKCSKYVWE